MIKDLLIKNRSYRRFDEKVAISDALLTDLIELTRYTASARNLQPLRYLLIHDKERCAKVFETLYWASYLSDWGGPVEGERPTAYIVVTKDTLLTNNTWCDEGLAIQSILLGAVEMGLGGCIIGAFNRAKLYKSLDLNEERYEILYVLAIGKPIECVVVECVVEGNIKYWRDENQIHHVPKRGLDELIIK